MAGRFSATRFGPPRAGDERRRAAGTPAAVKTRAHSTSADPRRAWASPTSGGHTCTHLRRGGDQETPQAARRRGGGAAGRLPVKAGRDGGGAGTVQAEPSLASTSRRRPLRLPCLPSSVWASAAADAACAKRQAATPGGGSPHLFRLGRRGQGRSRLGKTPQPTRQAAYRAPLRRRRFERRIAVTYR